MCKYLGKSGNLAARHLSVTRNEEGCLLLEWSWQP